MYLQKDPSYRLSACSQLPKDIEWKMGLHGSGS